MARCRQTDRRSTWPPTLPNDLLNSSLQLLECRPSSRRPRRHDEVQVPGDLRDARVKHLSESAPHGVPCYRVADLSGHGEAQPRGAMLVGKSVDREEPAPVSGSLAVDPLELRRVSQTHAFAAWQRSNCQALAAPAPAVGDDPAPAHRTHALAEAVRLGSLTTIWLISTLHRTPLRALRNMQTNHESISEASNTIQRSTAARPAPRTRDYPVPLAEKCCKTASRRCANPGSCIVFAGPEARPIRLRSRLTAWLLCGYPQPVDKYVDNHLNCLQKLILCPWAIAL